MNYSTVCKRLYTLLLVLILAGAFVEGLYQLGHEMGPAASVREQYRIFLSQRDQLLQEMKKPNTEQMRL